MDHRSRRGLSLRGDTLGRVCGLSKRLGGAIGWGRTFEGTVCANEENKPEDNRVQ